MKLPNPSPIISNASMAVAITSALIIPIRNYGYSIQANWITSGSLGGVLEIQISNDGLIWDTLEDSPLTLTGAGSFTWAVQAQSNTYKYAVLVYTPAVDDSGTLNAIANY